MSKKLAPTRLSQPTGKLAIFVENFLITHLTVPTWLIFLNLKQWLDYVEKICMFVGK